jgi:NAD(P)-dependent dehydrogenase (short-subunit alcohol dehydrogenase family)
MGAAKAAMEVLTLYFAVALAERGITVNTISPGWIEDSVLNSLPSAVQEGIRDWHKGGWTPMVAWGRLRMWGTLSLYSVLRKPIGSRDS